MGFFTAAKNLLGNTLKVIVPNIAAGLGIPAVGGIARNIITTVFDLKKDASDKEIVKAYNNASPEKLIELKTKELEFEATCKKLGVDLEREKTKQLEIAANDRNSARNREKTLKDDTPKTLAYLIVFGFFGFVLFAILKYATIPSGLHDLLFLVIGILSSRMAQVFEYYFGTSSSSRKKDKAIENGIPIDKAKELEY